MSELIQCCCLFVYFEYVDAVFEILFLVGGYGSIRVVCSDVLMGIRAAVLDLCF